MTDEEIIIIAQDAKFVISKKDLVEQRKGFYR